MPVIKFLKTVLLIIELIIYVAYVHLDKLLFVGIIALDQYVKFRVVSTMNVGETVPIYPEILHITYVLNPGAAFGILPHERAFLLGLSGVMLIFGVMVFSRIKKMHILVKYGGIFAAAGALGNMADRSRTGYVVDMFDLRNGFPIFNIADISILIGLMMITYYVFFISEDSDDVKEVRQ